MAKFDLKQYALRGAQARVAELKAELAEIYKTFPELARGGGVVASAKPAASRRRKPMSPAQKKAIGLRMKKYWADRRKAQSAK